MTPRKGVAAILLGFATASCIGVSTVTAGVADTPLPQFADAKQGVRVQIFPGVVKRDRLQTDFLCTVFGAEPVDVGVEIFDPAGTLLNDVQAGNGAVLDVAPGQTVTFGTSGTRAFLESMVVLLPTVSQGSARIVASSTKVRCTAMIVDDAVTPPVSLGVLGEGFRLSAGSILPQRLPLPQFASGRTATHSALVPGLTKRNRMQSDVMCTSLASENIDIGVQVIGPDGTVENDMLEGNGALLDVPPGATVTFGTTGTAALLESAVIVTRGVAQGAAHVVSTSGDVACNAVVLDAALTPPTAMASLTATSNGLPGDVNGDGAVSAADFPALVRAAFP